MADSNSSPDQTVVGHPTPADSDDEYERLDPVEEYTDSEEEEQRNSQWHSAGMSGRAGQSSVPSREGMLPRDMPQHTPFYDPVAERQLSQTDAKLFYEREVLSAQPPGTSPYNSPTLASSAAPPLSGHQLPPPMMQAHPESPKYPEARGPPSVAASLSEAPTSAPGPTAVPDLSGSGYMPGMSSVADLSGHDEYAPFSPDLNPATKPGAHDPHVRGEFATIAENIQRIVDLRRKYMGLSLQGPADNPKDARGWVIYPPPPDPAWRADQEGGGGATKVASTNNSLSSSMVLNSKLPAPLQEVSSNTDAVSERLEAKRKPGHNIGSDFELDDVTIPGEDGMTFALDDMGVYQVFADKEAEQNKQPVVCIPTIKEFYVDLDQISAIASDGPSKSFAFRRLQYLEGRFSLYILINEYQEIADSKKVPHRDFYNVRKVDTHVHHSACMNQKHLLRFIKSKLKKHPHEKVLFRDGKLLSLTEVFDSINLTAYDLSIDTLDMHAHKDSFHRFDKFNLKYNPVGESRLRTIFLKTDNDIQGRYLAEITKEVIADLESSKYQMVEWRISIYGKTLDEWDKLAAWVVDNKLFSPNVRWLIQIPRLYDVYKASKLMNSFEHIIRNIFQPLFEVSKDPQTHPKLHIFLQRVIGFDSVDDESKVERRLFKKFPVPNEWTSKQNPPYSYWIYYLFANTASLNQLRKHRGFNTLVIRPHCGEAGDSDHLSAAALCCHSISHGLLLRKVPILQYVFYLEQIGIAMSPLSNNALFLAYERNPFHQYFKRGLNVSLSTDDPLQFAFTKEPLIEEYAVAAQIYKLSPVDMCELAKNSVKQSGFEHSMKKLWLGDRFELLGKDGNDMVKTNIPDRRETFRSKTLLEEWQILRRCISLNATNQDELKSQVTEVGPGVGGPPVRTDGEGKTGLDPSHDGLRQATRTQGSSTGIRSLHKVDPHQVPRDSAPIVPPQSLTQGKEFYQRSHEGSSREALAGENDPRIFPGMVSRRRRDGTSLRQSSIHELDEWNETVEKELGGVGKE